MKTESLTAFTDALTLPGLVLLTLFASLFAHGANAEVIHEERSVYRNIIVTQEGDRRCLIFNAVRGERNQTCIGMTDPKEMLFAYTRMSMAGLLVNPNPQSILIAGLGGGTIPTALRELYPNAKIDVLEIDQAVVNVAREFFDYEEDENLNTHVVDARVFIKRAGLEGKKYDFIMLDAFTGEYIPEHLLTQEFLEEVKTIMTPDAVLVANTFSTSSLYSHESVTYTAVFGEFFNFKMPGSGNRVIIAQQRPLPDNGQLKQAANALQASLQPYGVPILEFPNRLTTRTDWDESLRVLTDQFSPGNLLR